MELYTKIDIPKTSHPLSFKERILFLGSCFAENIGLRMENMKFNVDINPFGTLYNPASITSSINRLLLAQPFSEEDLFEHEGAFHSFSHHSRFSSISKKEALEMMNGRLEKGCTSIKDANRIIITFGSAYVYRLKESGGIVANCHKLPEKVFDRYLLSVEEIVTQWSETISNLKRINPEVRFIFTVSPIRHWRDGAHGNQISKATLLLAIDQLQKDHSECADYFPAYEIMIDELRDYRFYAEDMIHPSSLAIDYIWKKFEESFFSKESLEIAEKWNNIKKALTHRPFQPDSEAHKRFLLQTLLKMNQLKDKFPYFDISNEIEEITNKI